MKSDKSETQRKQAEIAESKRAEEALRESEQKFIKIFQGNAAAIALTRLSDGRLIDVNEKWQELFGLSREEIVGKTTMDKIKLWKHPEEREQAIRDLKAHGEFRNREYEFLRKNGETWTALMSSEIIQLHGEKVILSSSVDITERKRAEEVLQESEKKYRTLFDSMTEGFGLHEIIFDAEGKPCDFRFLELNAAWEKQTGVPSETVVGKTMKQVWPDLNPYWLETLSKVAITGEPIHYENYNNSLQRWYETFAYSTAPNQFALLFIDITERKRAEEMLQKAHDELELRVQERTAELQETNRALQKSEELFRISVENMLDAFGIYYAIREPSGRIIDFKVEYVNTAACKANLMTKEEQIGKRLLELLPAHRESGLFDKYCQVVETGKPFIKESLVYEDFFGGGRRLCKAVDIQVMRLDDGFVATWRDVTERKQTEKKIREQAALLDNAQEAVEVRSLEHNLIYWNKGAQRLYGWTAEEALGKNPVEFLYKDKEEPPQLIEAKRIVLEKGEWIGELQQVTKDGREVIVESHWTLIYDSEGKPKSILVVNTDITEKKRFEAHLLRAQRMESIGVLAGGIAHNLNNLLTPMMMSLHTLKQKFKDEQSQKLLTILENNSQRSADLIKQVLSYSRGVEGERAPLHVAKVVSEIEKIAKETFPRNTEIRTDIPIDIWTISGDITQLHQVLMNLCVNARDAMPDGGILNISAENFVIDENYKNVHAEAKVGSYVAISVSDTGVGIPPKTVDRIFEPFFTTKEFGKGTGLGLSTAFAIVKSHGGFINVYSEVGKGTKFNVYLPATKTEIQNVEEQQPELAFGHGELVLVAEDEDSVREVTISTLKEYGYNVIAAEDGAQAVTEYAQNKDRIKVVLMDMMMPIMDGHASIRAIRKINPEVKIIAVSGLAEKDKHAKIESTRAQAILSKPYTVEKLLKTMHEVLSAK